MEEVHRLKYDESAQRYMKAKYDGYLKFGERKTGISLLCEMDLFIDQVVMHRRLSGAEEIEIPTFKQGVER